MNKLARCLLVAFLFSPASLALAQGYSYLGGWQPPTIYATNAWYNASAPFTSPTRDTITEIQWQLQWNLNNGSYGIPSGMEMKICDASNNCQTISSLTSEGYTTNFNGESADQTFTLKFMIPASRTYELNPDYIGASANSWLEEHYQD